MMTPRPRTDVPGPPHPSRSVSARTDSTRTRRTLDQSTRYLICLLILGSFSFCLCCSTFGNELKASQEVFLTDLDKLAADIDAFKNYGDLEQSEQVCFLLVCFAARFFFVFDTSFTCP